MIYVQFEDEAEETVVSWFGADPRSKGNEKFIGEVAKGDERYKEYYESLPDMIRHGMPDPAE